MVGRQLGNHQDKILKEILRENVRLGPRPMKKNRCEPLKPAERFFQKYFSFCSKEGLLKVFFWFIFFDVLYFIAHYFQLARYVVKI